MKAIPRILSVLLLCSTSLQAGDYVKKDADQMAAENLKQAKQMFEEAKHHSTHASQCSAEDAAVMNKFAQLTMEEAELLQKSGEAFEKKQVRLGERYQEKARELCDKRGKLVDKVSAIYQKDCDKQEAKAKPHTKEDKLAEIEKKEAELAAEKKRLLGQE